MLSEGEFSTQSLEDQRRQLTVACSWFYLM
jgi:hypothetical protein